MAVAVSMADAADMAARHGGYREQFGFPFIIAAPEQKNAQARVDEEIIALGELLKIADSQLRRCVDPMNPPPAGDGTAETSLQGIT